MKRDILVSHWIHIRMHQDTCILDSSSRYIRIHRDTKKRYMYLGRVMTTIEDTIKIHEGYFRNTCGIHNGKHVCPNCIQRGMYLKCKRHANISLYVPECIL